MDYDIVATLGPRSSSESVWRALISAGASSFRLNTSHMSTGQLGQWLDRVAAFMKSQDPRIRIILDLQGSKWRLGRFAGYALEPGQTVELEYARSSKARGRLPVPHRDFFHAALSSDGTVTLNDARVVLAIEKADSLALKARVVRGGRISSHKGITCPSSSFRSESLGDKDLEIIGLTRGMDGVRYAISYVKDFMEMSRYRDMVGRAPYMIAKLERKTALEEAARIAVLSDELWVCRGDLGAEMGLTEMAGALCVFSRTVKNITKPVLMAGQVLEHMTLRPVPTRSEVCFLHDVLADGYKGIVLSDETAMGRYPLESCREAAMFRGGLS